jgi:hypothetical protein
VCDGMGYCDCETNVMHMQQHGLGGVIPVRCRYCVWTVCYAGVGALSSPQCNTTGTGQACHVMNMTERELLFVRL